MLYSALGNTPPAQWKACALTVLQSNPRIFDEEARLAQMRITITCHGWLHLLWAEFVLVA